jgi:hypothetical protein
LRERKPKQEVEVEAYPCPEVVVGDTHTWEEAVGGDDHTREVVVVERDAADSTQAAAQRRR